MSGISTPLADGQRATTAVRGREWNSPSGETKYFNSLDVWQVEPTVQARGDEPPPIDDSYAPSEEDDIPF